jgi:hypothetical protein
VYEKLGHAEVVQLDISAEPQAAQQEFRRFAQTYFKQFNKTPFGMARQVGAPSLAPRRRLAPGAADQKGARGWGGGAGAHGRVQWHSTA